MERIVALVEGHTEFHFVRLVYANSIVIRPFPNGDEVSIDLIIESIKDALETISGDIVKVIIMLDREKREISSDGMSNLMKEKLQSLCSNRKIYIAVADRQIENWIMADEHYIKTEYNQNSYAYKGDGSRGKNQFLEICGQVSKGPRDKATILKKCSATRISDNSPSLANFRDQIDFDWAWITN